MKRPTCCILAAGLVIASLAGGTDAADLDQDLDLMMSWFGGEFDNHLQVVEEQEQEPPPEQPHEWIHSIFAPVELPAFGDHVFYVEQYTDGDPSHIYRNRLYSFAADPAEDAIVLTIYSFPDPAAVAGAFDDPARLAGLAPADLRTTPGCEVFWRRDGDRFLGTMKDGACRIASQRLGTTIVIDDDLVLTPDEIWISDRAVDEDGGWVFGNREGVHHKLLRSRPFGCWAVLDSDDVEEPVVVRGLELHDQGGSAALGSGDEPAGRYTIQLEQRVYRGERDVPVLKLAVLEEGEERSIAYTWTVPSATTIGLNLRWLQAGCTAE